MRIILVFVSILSLSTIVFLFFGNIYWNQKVDLKVSAAHVNYVKDLEKEAKENPLKGKQWVSYGDSIVAGETWQTKVTSKIHLSKHYLRGIGGTTVSGDGTIWWANSDGSYAGRPEIDSIQPEGTMEIAKSSMSSQERIDTMIPKEADLVLIMGGSNDWAQNVPIGLINGDKNKSSFSGSYQLMLDRISKRAPNTKIVLLLPPYRANMYENSRGLELDAYREAIIKIGKKYKYPVIDTTKAKINQSNYTTYLADEVHPNEQGGELIADVVITELKKTKF